MQTEGSILDAARRLDEALETGKKDEAVGFFAEDCELELLGICLSGPPGVRRWLNWVFSQFTRM